MSVRPRLPRARRRAGAQYLAALAVITSLAAGACGATGGQDADPGPPPGPLSPVSDYLAAVKVAHADHLVVWIETDLVKRWESGSAAFRAGVRRAAFLARQPGVAGIKVADELGYHDGMDSAAKIQRFLAATARAVRAAAPHAQILVDMVVPQLGCLPGHRRALPGAAACMSQAQAGYPQLALPQIDGYLRMHAIDVLDLSTGLLSPGTYASWGTSIGAAQQAAWREAARRGWPGLVRLQSRKALAHPGRYQGTPGQAEADLHTFVDIPLASGAHAVDVWTWHQQYDGAMFGLMNPGMKPNALWAGLARRHRDHDILFTHMSPHSVESGLRPDLATIATVFTAIFLPAGTG
jgi:hypothetical protein